MIRINPTKLLVEDITEAIEKTASGIILPDAVIKKTNMKAKVIIVGEGTPDIPMIWNVGDTVLFNPRSGQKVDYQEKEYRLIDIADVLLGGI